MKNKIAFFLLILVIGGGGIAHAAKNLIVCFPDNPAGFDAAQYVSVYDVWSAHPIFEKLLTFKRGSTTPEPALATHWKISPDGLTYTFYLRQGVKFHTTNYFKPTRDFNADDVIFTFERMRNPRHLFRLAYPAEFPVFSDLKLDEKIVKLSKIDPYTIKFMLKVPDATFLPNLATYFAPIHSFEYAQQLYRNRQAAHINQKPIGTGPFIFKRYIKNQQIRYVANKDYWDKSPGNFAKVDNLIFAITKEAAVEAKKIKAGECHIGNVPVEDVAQFQKDANFVVLTQPIMLFYALEYNTQKLKNPLVRQALDMALDKKAFIKIHKGFAQSITNPLPLLQWGYDKSIRNQSYDPIKAKLLLKKAGYSNGLTIKLFIALGILPTNDLSAQLIQKDWEKIGVKVKLLPYEHSDFFRRLHKGEHDVVFMGSVGNNGDPDDFLGPLTCGTHHFSRWCHKPFDRLVLKARQIVDKKTRIKLYNQAQKILAEEKPVTPLFNKMDFDVVHQSIKGYTIPVLDPRRYTGISIE